MVLLASYYNIKLYYSKSNLLDIYYINLQFYNKNNY